MGPAGRAAPQPERGSEDSVDPRLLSPPGPSAPTWPNCPLPAEDGEREEPHPWYLLFGASIVMELIALVRPSTVASDVEGK